MPAGQQGEQDAGRTDDGEQQRRPRQALGQRLARRVTGRLAAALTLAYTDAAAAVAMAAPTYLAMLDTPEAAPTSFSSTADVQTDEAGPLVSPMPTAISTSGRTNIAYDQLACTKVSAPKPAAMRMKPTPMIWRVPRRMASGLTSGVMASIARVAGRVATPAATVSGRACRGPGSRCSAGTSAR